MKRDINGNDLLSIGYKPGTILGLAIKTASKLKDLPFNEATALLKKVKDYPENFPDDEIMEPLAAAMIEAANAPADEVIELRNKMIAYTQYGEKYIEEGATKQMDIAMKLPVAVAGALMPDAHQGYGLPIGGVLATHNAIIPYGVGVDIGCRMALTIFDIPDNHFYGNEANYKRELIAHTKFGAGHGFHGREKADHSVIDNPDFNATPLLKQLKDKAYSQLGSSGGGNHFVEWGIVEFEQRDEFLNINKGKYLALLSHSGSRGFGATIAGYYTKLAKEICKLPQEAANLAYLDMNSAEGQERILAGHEPGRRLCLCLP